MPLILVQNEITVDVQYERWKDITGVQYHFPNQYKNKIEEGELFIYYRGVRKPGGVRGTPEYFGFGKIGRKWIDPESIGEGPKSQLEWFCEVVDYIPFIKPVPFKIGDEYFEKIPKNFWGVGVRKIDDITFHSILAAAGIHKVENEEVGESASMESLIKIQDVNPKIIESGASLVVPSNIDSGKMGIFDSSAVPRYSKYSKLYGDRSEEIVYRILTERFEHRLSWVAREGKKPGWDIEYYWQDEEVAVEVKGTSGKRFKSIEVTAGEWKAAEEKRENYNLYLVADCLGRQPLIQVLNNPYELYLGNKISLSPTNYRMTFNIQIR